MSYREPKEFFKNASGKPAGVVIFLSGSGTNAEKILDLHRSSADCPFTPLCLVTDHPLKSSAAKLGEKYGLEVIAHDIKEFYRSHGLTTISLATPEGCEVRQKWTDSLYEKISHFDIDFGIFAGFTALTNITRHFPCLNVHPGDLSICDDSGRRLLTGLHTQPVLKAVKLGLDEMRASVIIACAYEKEGKAMDEGVLVGLSPEVMIDWQEHDHDYWLDQISSRPSKRPKGGWQDEVQQFLSHNQEELKVGGDWIVLPKVVNDFARGLFAHLEGDLFYKMNNKWHPVEFIEYGQNKKEIHFNCGELE